VGTEAGLKLFEEITFLDDYYLTNAEIDALQRHAKAIARRLPEGSRLVELGSG
jgi:L-histidine Nalpha-methyltransferase / hercynylcysteine S-oxide synthase